MSVEEIEDEDMPRVPRWGPHPFADPTRPSLFPEPHPDPTAGAAFCFNNVDREAGPKYTSVLAEPDTFREAYWLDHLSVGQSDKAEYFALPRTCRWIWKDLTEFEQEVNRLPHGPKWVRETIIVFGDEYNEILDLWKRDIIEMIRFLLADPRFIPHTRYAPERHYDSESRENRVYNEMWSGQWWWEMQNILGPHATVVPIILSTDKTKLTVFSGNQLAWPVYLSIGNISKDIRRCPSERATLLIGYIPVSKLGNISNRNQRREAGWQLFHTCMESILEPLRILSRTGIDVQCADGGIHRIFPILAAYIADYPEQSTITCVLESCCPACWIPSQDRGDLTLRYPLRDRCRTLDALDDCWSGYSQTIKTLGIRPTRPFWANLPYVDISMCLAPDLLHQIDRGVFGDHVLKWTTALLTSEEMDRWTKGMPRFQDLRHFSRGISVISHWTGKEAKAVARTILTIVAGYRDPRLVRAVGSVVDFMTRAHKHEVTNRDIRAMKADLIEFNRSKGVFVDPDKPGLLDDEAQFNGIAKTHSLTHYPYLICQLGAPEGLSTEITERLHIDYVKIPWSTTNHVNPTQQMIAYLLNREAWALLRAYMHDSRLVMDPRFREDWIVDEDRGEGEPEVVVNGDDGGRVWHPAPTVQIAKRPSVGPNVKGTYLINKQGATDLVPATIEYLRSLYPTHTAFPISHNSVFQVWRRCKLLHPRLPFDPTLGPHTNQVRAFVATEDSEGRVLRVGFFDVALYSPSTGSAYQPGLRGLEAGRVRAIFSLADHHKSLSSEKLVYLERFRPFPHNPSPLTSLYTTQHALQGGRRSAIVVPLSQLRMTCHLAPRYHLLDPNTPVSSTTNLLTLHQHFSLNKYASAWLFSVLDYWENQRRINGECLNLLSFNMHESLSYPPLAHKTYPYPRSKHKLRLAFKTSSTPRPLTSHPTSINLCASRSALGPSITAEAPIPTAPNTSAGDQCTPPFSLGSNPTIEAPCGIFEETLTRYSTRDGSPCQENSRFAEIVGSSPPELDFPNSSNRPESDQPGPNSALNMTHRRDGGMRPPGLAHRPAKLVRSQAALGLSDVYVKNGGGSPLECDLPVNLETPCSLDVRRIRIVESEQRRRNDLRGGFAWLKDALPASHEKCSKVVLLERAATYIGQLEARLRATQDSLSSVGARHSVG
ncbi:helix loop helix DNA-binding domain protein [Ceratobasidium sp. AG-Ba]|nr:helix loop helix DNA-binding domain protein [Ceratobasidium sp. AG-Ba]